MGESTGIVRRITDDILFIAKVESDQFRLIFSPLSASDLIYSVVHQQNAQASVKGVTLSTSVGPDIPLLLLGDENRIRQIITNLTSNGTWRGRCKWGDALWYARPCCYNPSHLRAAIKFVPERIGLVQLAVFFSTGHPHRTENGEQRQSQSARISESCATRLGAESGGNQPGIPGTISRRSFVRRLPNTAAGALRSRSANVYPSDVAVDEMSAAPPLLRPTPVPSNPRTWLGFVAGLSRRLVAPPHLVSPPVSSPCQATGGGHEQLSAADLESQARFPVRGVSSSLGRHGDNAENLRDSRLPFAGLQGDSETTTCPHIVDVPEGIVATPTVITLRFEVRDNGRGLSAEQRNQLFKPYAQVTLGNEGRQQPHAPHRPPPLPSQILTSQTHGGTGLGLYISMRLAKQMGGCIGVDSEGEGRGSTFWCEIPVRVLEKRTPAAPEASSCVESFGTSAGTGLEATVPPLPGPAKTVIQVAVAAPGPASRPTSLAQPPTAPLPAPMDILIVDDVDSSRMLMRRLLTQHAPTATIHEAADGLAACALMAAAKKAEAPLFARGIVCMDKEMPQCDGCVATQRIRSLGFTGLILGITGNALAEDVEAFLACGADVVLAKPLSFPMFMGHVRRFAGGELTRPSQTDLQSDKQQ